MAGDMKKLIAKSRYTLLRAVTSDKDAAYTRTSTTKWTFLKRASNSFNHLVAQT
jgi:hypothetical protein